MNMVRFGNVFINPDHVTAVSPRESGGSRVFLAGSVGFVDVAPDVEFTVVSLLRPPP